MNLSPPAKGAARGLECSDPPVHKFVEVDAAGLVSVQDADRLLQLRGAQLLAKAIAAVREQGARSTRRIPRSQWLVVLAR